MVEGLIVPQVFDGFDNRFLSNSDSQKGVIGQAFLHRQFPETRYKPSLKICFLGSVALSEIVDSTVAKVMWYNAFFTLCKRASGNPTVRDAINFTSP